MTVASGIHFTYQNGEDAGHLAILEALGGGLGVLDFDGDGRLDLFITGGGYFGGPDKKQIRGHPCKLYRNLGNFRFEDVTAKVGLDKLAGGEPWFYSHGVAVGDYDRDGWPDLLVTGHGQLALFHNEPVDPKDPGKGRRFVDVTKQAGLPRGLWTTGAAWGDLDGDGWPDLYCCQYVDWSLERNHPLDCTLDNRTREICSPKRFKGLEHKLFRNRGDGTFEDVSKPAGLRVARTDAEYDQLDWLDQAARQRLRQSVTEGDGRFGKGLGVLLVDVNGDARPDIYVANDIADNFLYVNNSVPGKIRLSEEGLLAGVARDDMGLANASMGLDAADYDGSGRASLWVTNYEGELHALYRNRSQPGHVVFVHSTTSSGIAALGQKTVGWGTGFLDLNHHGQEDLFFTAGDVYNHNPNLPRAQPPVLFRNQGGGRFQIITPKGGPYFQTAHKGRGAVLADFDNDGRIDLAICHLNEPVAILRNEADTAGRHWLGVELRGAGGRDVIGAGILLEAGGRTQTRFAKAGSSYLSSCDPRHLFGLGQADHIDCLRVVWPGRKEQQWRGLAPDRYWRLREGEPEAEPLYRNR
jgi:hypothetical protein